MHLSALSLHCCADFPRALVARGRSVIALRGPHCGGFSCSLSAHRLTGARASGTRLLGPEHRLGSWLTGLAVPRHVGSSDQGSNPGLLHWEANCLPLHHQESLKALNFLGNHACQKQGRFKKDSLNSLTPGFRDFRHHSAPCMWRGLARSGPWDDCSLGGVKHLMPSGGKSWSYDHS